MRITQIIIAHRQETIAQADRIFDLYEHLRPRESALCGHSRIDIRQNLGRIDT
jgi:hypothetical protein